MPTSKPLKMYDVDRVKALTLNVLDMMKDYEDCIWVFQYYFELTIILKCKSLGWKRINARELYEKYPRWDTFRTVRNTLSHDLSSTEECIKAVRSILDDGILVSISEEFLGDEKYVEYLILALEEFDFEEFERMYLKKSPDYVWYKGKSYRVDDVLEYVNSATIAKDDRKAIAEKYVEAYVELR